MEPTIRSLRAKNVYVDIQEVNLEVQTRHGKERGNDAQIGGKEENVEMGREIEDDSKGTER